MFYQMPIPFWFKLKHVFHITSEKPLAKKRPKAFRMGEHIRFYNPQGKDEKYFRYHIKQQMLKKEPLEGPIFVHMVFYMPRPKGDYGTGKNSGILKASAADYHIKKPDEDNLSKFVKDAMNGIVYRDDSQVVGAFTWKEYEKNGGTVIRVYSLLSPHNY